LEKEGKLKDDFPESYKVTKVATLTQQMQGLSESEIYSGSSELFSTKIREKREHQLEPRRYNIH
jgi:hypothetical protein